MRDLGAILVPLKHNSHTTIAVSEDTLLMVHDLAWRWGTTGRRIVETLVRAAAEGRDGVQELAEENEL